VRCPLAGTRVAEHFTVVGERIVRLRQVHDTASLRGGEFDSAVTDDSEEGDYQGSVDVLGRARNVFVALTDRDGIAGWWTSIIEGSDEQGGTITLGFDGLDEKIVFTVLAAAPDQLLSL
jgi:hypothetical protein